ncbi:MAG: MATE family efflux transporter [Muribaculaceae bacterium]|nr:MATE family efflux transporter [Muribaculaceae bacterium]
MTEKDRLQELGNAPVGRLLWKYSLPAIVGMVVMSIYNVIDRIFIGQGVGPEAIAGLAITFPVMNISAAFGVLVGAGAGARTSIVLGQDNRELAERILGNSFVMTLLFGTFYIAMLGIFIDPILMAFGADEVTLPYAREFMVYMLPGLLFNNITFSYNNVMRATGYPTQAMISMFIGAGLNLVLAPIAIFGLKLGIKGAAIATDISMFISMCFVLHHFLNPRSVIHFKRGTFSLSWRVLAPVLAIGAAPCIVNTAGCVINAIVNNTLKTEGGPMSVGAMGIFVTFTQLLVTFVLGVCMGMQPIVGYNYGARKFDRLKRTYWMAVAVATAVCALGTLVAELAPYYIARPFTADAQLIDESIRALRLTTWMFWGVGFQIVSTNFFQSIGRAGKSIFMSLSRQVIFMLPLLLVLPPMIGLNGVWLSFPISDFFANVFAAFLIAGEFRRISRLTPTA